MTGTDVPLARGFQPAKQGAQRHYGSHPYFTKRAWNVVQEYVKHFSSPGDTVLDPFGGSGVTAVESLVLRRKAIYVDVNPWACFLARLTALAPVNLGDLHAAFAEVEQRCAAAIEEIWRTPVKELARRAIRDWYPQNAPLPGNADVAYVEELFTPRMLHGLAKLRATIMRTRDPVCRDLLLMAFSATLVRINRTFLSAAGRAESRGGSAIFSIYRYKVAQEPVELPLWPQFAHRFRKLVQAKRETNQLIGDFYQENQTAVFRQASATALSEWLAPESVDYVYTDPPYGGHIAYLDLSTMWTAWLGMEVTARDRDHEVVEGGSRNKSREDYERLLSRSLVEIHRALKPGAWLSLVFAHRDISYWGALVRACEGAGLAYCNTVVQPVGVVWSMHKKKNPLRVLSGELVLNFRKTGRPRRSLASAGRSNALEIVLERCEAEIIRNTGASTEDLHHTVVPALLEHGSLEEFARMHGDLVPLLEQHFLYDADAGLWQLCEPRTCVGRHDQRALARYYVSRYLDKLNGDSATLEQVLAYLSGIFALRAKFDTEMVRAILNEVGTSGDEANWCASSRHAQGELAFQR